MIQKALPNKGEGKTEEEKNIHGVQTVSDVTGAIDDNICALYCFL